MKKNNRGADIPTIEFRNKNIHLENGIAGLTFLNSLLLSTDPNRKKTFDNDDLLHRISESEYWTYIQGKEKKELGLLNGIAGISWAMLTLSI